MIALRDFLQGTSETALRKILRKYSLALRNRAKEERQRRKGVDGVRQDKKYYSKFRFSFFRGIRVASRVRWLEISFVPVYFVYGPFNSQTHQPFALSPPLRFPVHFALILLLRVTPVFSLLYLFGGLFFPHQELLFFRVVIIILSIDLFLSLSYTYAADLSLNYLFVCVKNCFAYEKNIEYNIYYYIRMQICL